MLLYHVVPGATVTYRQALEANGARLATALEGSRVRVKVVHRVFVQLVDADKDDRNPYVVQPNLNKGTVRSPTASTGCSGRSTRKSGPSEPPAGRGYRRPGGFAHGNPYPPLSEVLLEQSRTVAAWLRSLDEDDFAASSVLAGWSAAVAGHPRLRPRTLHESLNRTTVERPLPVHVYVQGYRPNADQIADASRSAAEADDVVSALDAEIERCAEALAAGPPSVALVRAARSRVRTWSGPASSRWSCTATT